MKIKFRDTAASIVAIATFLTAHTAIGAPKTPSIFRSPSRIDPNQPIRVPVSSPDRIDLDQQIRVPAAVLSPAPRTIYGQFKWTGAVPATTKCQDFQVSLVSYEQVTPDGPPDKIVISEPLFKYSKKLSTTSANRAYPVSTTPGICHYSVNVADKKYVGQGARLSFSAPAGGADTCGGRPQNEAVSIPSKATENNVEVEMSCSRVN